MRGKMNEITNLIDTCLEGNEHAVAKEKKK